MSQTHVGLSVVLAAGLYAINATAGGDVPSTGSETSSATTIVTATRSSGYAGCGTPAPLHLDPYADVCYFGPVWRADGPTPRPDGLCGQFAVTAAPIDLLWGRVHEFTTDLHLPSGGADVVVRRRYAPDKLSLSLFPLPDGSFTWGWEAHLTYDDANNPPEQITFHRTPDRAYTYEGPVQGTPDKWKPKKYPTGPDDTKNYTYITQDAANEEFVVHWTYEGWQAGFWDHDYATADLRGRLKWYSGPDGLVEISYGQNNRPATITITDGSDEFRQLDLTYVTISSVDYLSRIVVREGDGAGNIIAIIDYTYFDSASQSPDFHDDFGTNGDLVQVKVRRRATGDAAGTNASTVVLSIQEITQYRYCSSATGVGGGAHTLKMIFRPDAYARVKEWADNQNPAITDLFTITDANADDFASYQFEYGDPSNVTGSDRFVTSETVRGGCGGCGGGGGAFDGAEFTFDYYDADHKSGRSWPSNPDDTAMEGVLTRPDGAVEHYYITSAGLVRKHKLVHSSNTLSERTIVYDGDNRPTTIDLYTGVQWEYTYYTEQTQPETASPIKYEINETGGGNGTDVVAEIAYDESGREDLPTALTFMMTEGSASGTTINISYTFHGSGTTRVKQVTIKYPAVPESENGEGTGESDRAVEYSWLDEQGRLVWRKDAEGRVDYFVYDDSDSSVPASRRTGLLWQRVADINTNSPPSGVNLSGVTIPYSTTSGANLLTTTVRDSQGRPTKVTDPSGRATSFVYLNDEVRTHVQLNASTGKTTVPTQVVVRDDALGQAEVFAVSADFAFDLDATNLPTGDDTFTEGDKVSKVVSFYNDGGGLIKTRVYHDIVQSLYNETLYGYSTMGQTSRVVDAEGTITRYGLDALGRTTRLWIGTDDVPTSGSWGDNPSTAPAGTNMKLALENTYSSKGNLTTETHHADSSTTRVVNHLYDWKTRRTVSYGESATSAKDYYEKWEYNNLNLVTKSARYNGYTLSGNDPVAGSKSLETRISYDAMTRVWKEVAYQSGFLEYSIDPGLGSPSADEIFTYRWYDRRSRPVKVQTKGGPATKHAYDSLGRVLKTFTTDAGGDAAAGATGTNADASTVTGDIVLEQVNYVYNDGEGGMLFESRAYQRDHDATGTGEITSTSVGRPFFTHLYYDAIDRPTHTVEYGTNGSSESVPTYASTVPTPSSTILVSQTIYDTETGRAFRFIDPSENESRYLFDDAGRVIWAVENYTNFDPTTLSTIGGGTNNDQDRVTKYAYNANGDVETLSAYQSSSVSQVTKYAYGVTDSGTGASALVSNSMLHAVIYPDSDDVADPLGNGTDTVYDRVELAYNRQGEPTWVKDQRGVVREFEYDKLGRFLADKATTIPSSVDNAIQRLERSYNLMGWTQNITSRGGSTDSSSIANQVNLAYNGFGQVLKSRQAHSGAAGSSTISASYAYADGDLVARLTTLTYPQTSAVTYTYNSGLDSTVSRVSALTVSSANVVEYSYLGLGTPVIVDYAADPDIRLDYTKGNDSGSDKYKSFDRFGRITLQNWVHYPSSDVDVVKIAYTFDNVSNRLSRDEQVALPSSLSRDEVYSYDNLYRVIKNLRGAISSGTISNPDETEKWTLDHLGNWSTFQFDGDGDDLFTSAADINDSRSHASPGGLANEITEWDPFPANSSSSPVDPVYDLAGNITDDDFRYLFTYDCWNRLVKVESNQDDPPTLVVEYEYDAVGRRIERTIGTDDPIHEYYTESWQRIESRPGSESSTTGVVLYVYGTRYLDDIVMRQRDANASGPPEERRYYLTDANYNVVMLTTDGGLGVERIFYTAYGEPEVAPFGDVDGDYDVDSADQTAMTAIKNGQASYNILADLNLDGSVTQADLNLFSNYSGYSGGRGILTSSKTGASVGNEIGYAGYTWNDERTQWHVRTREYDPKLGRWLQRDPIGYDSGINLYLYANGAAINAIDPFGLQVVFPPEIVEPRPFLPYRSPYYGPRSPHRPLRRGPQGPIITPTPEPLPAVFPEEYEWPEDVPRPGRVPVNPIYPSYYRIPWWVPPGPWEIPPTNPYPDIIGPPGCDPFPSPWLEPERVPDDQPLPPIQWEPEPVYEPVKRPVDRGLRNKGQTCENWYLDDLEARKRAACVGGRCRPGMTCDQLREATDKAQRCLFLRLQICQECYGGIEKCDPEHQEELRNRHQGWRNCLYWLGIKCGQYRYGTPPWGSPSF